MALQVGQLVKFKDNGDCWGTVFEFQDEGMVAGLRNVSQKIKDMGAGEETHEPVENLELIDGCQLCVGQTVYLKSDGPEVTGEIFELLMDGPMVLAGLKPGAKLLAMGTPEVTHEPAENLAVVA
ncbi:hypothetical protein Ctob_013274 [Chrysochromulina tobinii]|uniref:Uncharacterized protein n=1 Tax=Chrysochromulina tobinii TaxID=1460289 RepID=A0A0M0JXY1_9EUKA|nr:hypothetical protein Ctob_013274 [Chrysochromulina tobinii]|eukprot:KOO30983.1 hypothetical protein Ctob_013274 [Chrysochromulina sp. CCMP291]